MERGLKDNKKGFTLVEIMVSMTLTILILLIMSSFIFNTIKCYKVTTKIDLQYEYLKECVICINKILENSNEVIVEENKINVKTIDNEINIELNNSNQLIIDYCKFKRKEIITSGISDIKFYEKNNLIYLYVKNKRGGEVKCSIPLNKI